MSRGPGRMQRLILQAVADGRTHYLAALLPISYTRAEYNALNRASRRLEEAGQIVVYRFACGWRKTVIARPGVPRPVWNSEWGRLNVGRAPSGHPSNPYSLDGAR